MNKETWKEKAISFLDTKFINGVVENVVENLGKVIYEAQKQYLEKEPRQEDEKRFLLKVVEGSKLPKTGFYFDEKLVGYIEQKEFHGLDIIGNNYTITLEFTPIR